MTFDEWYETAVFPNADDSVTARAAWSHQQAEIERLREDIRCLTKADIVRVPTKDSQQARIAELEKAATEVVECGVDGMAYDRRVVLDALAALLPGGTG